MRRSPYYRWGGFNLERAKALREGVELTLGSKVRSVAVLDRDFRSSAECKYLAKNAEAFNDWVRIHSRKEIENFLLVPSALDRAIQRRLEDRQKRTGAKPPLPRSASEILSDFRSTQHPYVLSRRIELSKKYEKKVGSKLHPDVLTEQAIVEFEKEWNADECLFALVPGKSALAAINQELQNTSSVTISPSNIIAAMKVDEIPADMKALVAKIDEFART